MSPRFPSVLVVPRPGNTGERRLDHIQHETHQTSNIDLPAPATKVRYKLEIAGCNNPWADSMRPHNRRLLGTDTLGARTL
jgi:hypothetical protein